MLIKIARFEGEYSANKAEVVNHFLMFNMKLQRVGGLSNSRLGRSDEESRSEIMGLEASTLSAYFEWLPASAFAVFKTISDKPTTSGYGYFDDVWNQKGSDCNPPR
ncbi:hypothetical protein MCOR07_004981 [Pyricularia oryzae]|uniref:Uncharacterized protein n=1 Tax=Pyricularia oryzae TaxID=318829 RepID=A0A4P7N788_PYROR|nr:hypothetical protein MCOR32_006460 [Pyricularia oryzae]KAI6621281.1 hypothetical protein MCOR07_004981 [Pyricularia oryzae]QBZ55900.1 hypothetical protein PoMZ_00806 [Pyricularia oryzae]